MIRVDRRKNSCRGLLVVRGRESTLKSCKVERFLHIYSFFLSLDCFHDGRS